MQFRYAMELQVRFELTTDRLQVCCAANCAIVAYIVLLRY